MHISADRSLIVVTSPGPGTPITPHRRPAQPDRKEQDPDRRLPQDVAAELAKTGASLALEAAVALGGQVRKLALSEPPYNDDPAYRRAWGQYISQLTEALPAGRGGDAIALFMAPTGTPAEQIGQNRTAPFWPGLAAIAPTLAYDHSAILGNHPSAPAPRAAHVAVPTLATYEDASYPLMDETARALTQAIPRTELCTLAGQSHQVSPDVLAPVLAGFFTT